MASFLARRSCDLLRSYGKSSRLMANAERCSVGQMSSAAGVEADSSKPPKMVKSTAEWHFVERLLPEKLVPVPPAETKDRLMPSGWKMPSNEKPDLPYFVERTSCFMVPVYLKDLNRGRIKNTVIRRVHGNVWALEKDIRAYLEGKYGDIVASTVHEPRLQVILKGDYVNDVKRWLLEKGF